MAKELYFDKDARERIGRGINLGADAVCATWGPAGRLVAIEEPGDMSPIFTKDGISVARHIFLSDPMEYLGFRAIRDVAAKTVAQAGDGTTCSIGLARAIFNEGINALNEGANPHALKQGIDMAVAAIVHELSQHSLSATSERIIQIGTISSNNDPDIGKLMAKAKALAGDNGVIVLADAIGYDTTLEHIDGMQLGRGWVDQQFVTDRSKDECVLEDVYILLWEGKLSAISPAINLLKQIQARGGSFLVIAEDIDGDALETLKTNHARNVLKSCAVRIPGHPLHRPGTLLDIASMTGATAITSVLDISIPNVTMAHLGRASKVVIGKENTLLIEAGGAPDDIANRVKELKALVAQSSGNERDLLQKRLADLSGGMVVVRVGAFTENEALEKKYRVEDAMHAVQAASEEGIVPGGGIALARCGDKMTQSSDSKDVATGIEIIRKATLVPLSTIVNNAGQDPDKIIANLFFSETLFSYGYNALTDNFENLLATGVVDPTKVIRCALQNAASIAALLLTVSVGIIEHRPSEAVMALMSMGQK